LPLGQMNAMAMRVPATDQHIVVFQTGVFGFLNLMSTVVARSMPFVGTEESGLKFSTETAAIAELLDSTPVVHHRFVDLLGAYIFVGHPHAARQYVLEMPWLNVSQNLLKSAESFILGHEFGHIILGHLDGARDRSAKRGGVDVDMVEESHEQELAADLMGLVLTLKTLTANGYDIALSYWGIEVALRSVDIVHRGLAVARGLPEATAPSSDTHPSPEERREFLRIGLGGLVQDENRVAGALQLADSAVHVIDELWARTRTRFGEFDLEPAEIWV
jgi:hypothetical protein